MITTDFHLHSCISPDSDTPMEEMIQIAIQKGMTTLCFTEHMEYENNEFTTNPEDYFHTFFPLKDIYQDRIELLFGIEIGMQTQLSAFFQEFAKKYPFDFIISSSHVVNEIDPYIPEYFSGCTEEQGYRNYFEAILKSIQSFDDFDIYGHLDYVVRYGPNQDKFYTYEKYRDIIDSILMLLIEKGKGIELNTAGIKYGLAQMHPHKDILLRYRQLGGTILSIGSDAHCPEHIGYAFEQARTLLLTCGFDRYTVFRNREPQFILLS